MARRRANEAALPEDATAAARLATGVEGFGFAAFTADDVFAAEADALPSAAFPLPDSALRLASASARPEFACEVAVFVMRFPV